MHGNWSRNVPEPVFFGKLQSDSLGQQGGKILPLSPLLQVRPESVGYDVLYPDFKHNDSSKKKDNRNRQTKRDNLRILS
jgi:hypothetical protein